MTWSAHGPQGNESAKIRFEVLPYLSHGGLDIGCGPSKVWPHLIGVDNQADTALFGIQMRPDIVVNNAARLVLFADQSADAVFSSHTLEHIDDWHQALREWWRLVKVGGHLILYLPHRDLYPRIGQPGANPDHKHDFDPDVILDFCRLAFPDWALVQNQVRSEGIEYSFLLVLRKEPHGSGQSEPWSAPKPAKTAGMVRLGGNGDALWAASVAAHLRREGYSVTAYVGKNGEEVLRHDPNIDRLITLPTGLLCDEDLLNFWAHEGPKYDRWINLLQSVEGRLLPHQSNIDFYMPQALRHRLMNINYLDMVHDFAELPAGSAPLQKFYPTEAEQRWAREMRERIGGPLVVISPTGSGPFKTWPHAQEFMRLMAVAGVYTVMLGDLKGLPDLDLVEIKGVEYGHVVGQEWPLRLALAYTLLANAVVATESVFANAVAYEPMPKVIMLSHSSHENLTRDWPNTAVLSAPVACHPCHRIHNAGSALCTKDTETGASACMAHYGPHKVADLVLRAINVIPAKAGIQELKAA